MVGWVSVEEADVDRVDYITSLLPEGTIEKSEAEGEVVGLHHLREAVLEEGIDGHLLAIRRRRSTSARNR